LNTFFYESPGADHEWQTWRCDLKDFALRLFWNEATADPDRGGDAWIT